MDAVCLLIQHKICRRIRNIPAPELLVFLQWMPADIHTEHFFFKGQKNFLRIFPDIREADFIVFLFRLVHQIE